MARIDMLTLERDDSALLPGMFRLAVTAPDEPQPTIQVVDGSFALVGRTEGCTCRFDHPAVGRRHAYLQAIYGRIYCIDLGSAGGTLWGDSPRRAGGSIRTTSFASDPTKSGSSTRWDWARAAKRFPATSIRSSATPAMSGLCQRSSCMSEAPGGTPITPSAGRSRLSALRLRANCVWETKASRRFIAVSYGSATACGSSTWRERAEPACKGRPCGVRNWPKATGFASASLRLRVHYAGEPETHRRRAETRQQPTDLEAERAGVETERTALAADRAELEVQREGLTVERQALEDRLSNSKPARRSSEKHRSAWPPNGTVCTPIEPP